MKKALMLLLVVLFIPAYACAQTPATTTNDAAKTNTSATIDIQAAVPQVPQESKAVADAAQAAPVAPAAPAAPAPVSNTVEYKIGIDDVLDINVLQPQPLAVMVTVAPDGLITFPYIGNVAAKDLTLAQIQDEIQKRLADGYMKYPVVSVSLKESRSKKFFVYGEVNRPGTYLLDSDETVLKAISMAGGFTRFGSSNRVKVLRPKANGSGTDVIKVNINDVMNGKNNADIVLKPGDTVVVNEGMF